MSEVRIAEILSESALTALSNALSPAILNEPLIGGYSAARIAAFANEPLVGGYSHARVANTIVESLFLIPPEPFMSDLAFPGFGNSASDNTVPAAANPSGVLRGMAYSSHKKPLFKTRVSESASGREQRVSLADMPRWQFDIPFEFLEDSSGLDSSLRTFMGFFLAMRGSFDIFLVKDPGDYLSVASLCGTGDGTILQFPITRTLGAFAETVGQVDTSNTVTVSYGITETDAVPGTGPYTVTVAHAADLIEDKGVTIGGTALTKVTGSPAAMEYAEAAGIYTFNSAQHGASAAISYRYTAPGGDYTVTLPNQLVFASAVPDGTAVYVDCQFFFLCRFLDDTMDFEKFMNQLWSIGTVSFRSVIL